MLRPQGMHTATPLAQGQPHGTATHQADAPRKDILPLIDFSLPATSDSTLDYIDTYTRIYVEDDNPPAAGSNRSTGRTPCEEGGITRCYSSEHSPWGKRLVWRQEISRVLSVKIEIKNPDTSATSTIAASSYKTLGSKGETWDTEVHGKLFLTPLFRIDNNTVLRAEATLNATSIRKDQVSGSALSVMYSAAQLLTPASALLTSFNAQDIDRASKFVSQTLSGLFSNSVTEKAAAEFASPYLGSADLGTISAHFPSGKKIYDNDISPIGRWKIKASPPTISVFSSVPVACGLGNEACRLDAARKALADILPSKVLNFVVGPQITMRDALMTDATLSSTLDKLRKGAATGATGEAAQSIPDQARSICAQIEARANHIGLNRFDAAAVLWAFSHDPSLSEAEGRALRGASACEAARLARNIWQSDGQRAQEQPMRTGAP